LATIAAGTYDEELQRIGKVLASYEKPVYLRFAHEMNAAWYPWGTGNGNTPAQYVAAWRHVHAVISSAAPGVRVWWVWSPDAAAPAVSKAPLSSFYPGDDVVDFVGMTGYATPGNDQGSAFQTFGRTLAALGAITQKPAILAEVGAAGPRKNAWLWSLGDFLRAESRIAGIVYFDTSPTTTGASGDYALRTADDLTALRRSLIEVESCRSTGGPSPG
jgi:beta-mannanase